ncbi:zinc finger (Ran-binding) family protein [Abeliophyllum distichum]|uniref:Zinc finger (Ran-binding) family protein n=1 Tax=Abeliophyllum distichum TaxID=126358 RepID=A0ABD1RQ70_9LAMI
MVFSHFLLRRLKCHPSAKPRPFLLRKIPKNPFSSNSTSDSTQSHPAATAAQPTSLSARMSFVFEQIDAIDKQRSEKDQTLQRIRAWRESKKQNPPESTGDSPKSDSEEKLQSGLVQEIKDENRSEGLLANVKREVELVHPWTEWIELMERLVQQNYFDHRRKDEDGMMEGLGFELSEAAEDKVPDFTRDFKSVQTAVLNFGRDRFDILRSLSRQDLQILVGYGCPSTDKRVVFSAKLLRKHVHLDEGDVCSSCSMRGSCEKAYLLTNKEDEPRTIDVMRVLLTYGFDPVNGSVSNMSLLKMKSVKTVVRKLLHEVVKLGAVPIDPNLPPPVIKKPPPKVKQPPPPPKKRVGRDDIEMKKGDWLCPKCDFMNFAKNTVCLQCDAKRPKRQLLPGEWECPQCNFLNYRRNTVCFHCEHNRPPDTYSEPQFPEKQHGTRMRMEKISNREEVSNAWNFDFDDNESDGADVAAFEYADSKKPRDDFSLNRQGIDEISKGDDDGFYKNSRPPRMYEPESSDSGPVKPRTGFNDFDDEDDIDSYELDTRNEVSRTSRIDFSELESNSESEDIESNDGKWNAHGRTILGKRSKKPSRRKGSFSGSEDAEVDFDSDDDLPVHPNWKSTHVANFKQRTGDRRALSFGSDDDLGSSGSDENLRSRKNEGRRQGSNRIEFEKRGRSNVRAEPFSDSESDDELGYRRDERRGKKAGPNRQGKPSMGRGGGMTGYRKNAPKDDINRSTRGPRYDRGTRENGYEHGMNTRDSDSPKFRSPRQGGSFNKQGGRSDNFGNRSDGHFNKQRGRSDNFGNRSDGYLDDERYRRPRINVR